MPNYEIRSSSLTSEEITQLQNNLKGMITIGIIVILFFSGVFSVLPNEISIYIGFGCVALFFMFVIGRQITLYIKDITGKEKLIIRGTITDRRLHFLRKSTRSTAYIYFDDQHIPVNFEHYHMVKTGDTVEIHYAPHTENSFALIPIYQHSRAQSFKPNKSYNQKSSPLNEILTPRDKKVMINFFRYRFIFLGFVFLFATYLMAGLILNGLYGILIFLFPIPILFITIIYFIIKNMYKMISDIRSNTKIAIKAFIYDKSVIRRRAKNYYFLKTDKMEIQINGKLYEAIETNQNVTLKLSNINRILLSVITADHEEIMNE